MAPDGDVLSSTWLSGLLHESSEWPHGSVRVLSAARIGSDHGLSGCVHRVVAETERGGSISFVVKEEGSAEVERELLFRRDCEEHLRGCIPACLAGTPDAGTGRGVLVLEDVAPAEQGDVLEGCTHAQAEAAIRALARVHGASWRRQDDAHPADLPRWRAAPMEPARWIDRVERARARFPEALREGVLGRIDDLPERVSNAVDELRLGPSSWIQVDAHLDNVLWRPDGTAVLLDWCSAAVGPPVVDITRFLAEGVIEASEPERIDALLSTYASELGTHGAHAEPGELCAGLRLALLPLVQSAVGWAGREDLELEGRAARLCESLLRCACDLWLAEGEL